MTYDLARKGFLQGYVNYTYNFKEFVITLNLPGDTFDHMAAFLIIIFNSYWDFVRNITFEK